MSYLYVRVAHVTIAFPKFVFFVRKYEFAACSAFSLALTDELLISDSSFMVGETCFTSEMSVAVRAGDSNPRRYTRQPRHTAVSCQVTRMCHIATASLAARFTYIPFGHGCCQVPYHVIMTGNLIVRQIQSSDRVDPPLEHIVITI